MPTYLICSGSSFELRRADRPGSLGATLGVVMAWPVSPQKIFVTMLDEIATVDELKVQIAISIGVREPLVAATGACGVPHSNRVSDMYGTLAPAPRSRQVPRRRRRPQAS